MRMLRTLLAAAALLLACQQAQAAKLANLACMFTETTGTGSPVALTVPVTGYLSFDAAGVQDGETYSYGIEDGANSEVGRGVYTASGTTLTRNVLASTNGGSPINLSGTAKVCVTPLAEDFKEFGATITPDVAGGAALGSTSKPWSGINLSEGGAINWENFDCVLAQTGDSLGLTGCNFNAETLGESIEALSEDVGPEPDDLLVTQDISADTGKKAKVKNLSGLVKLASGSVTNAASLDLPLDTYGSDYVRYELTLIDCDPATDAVDAWLRFSTDGGAIFKAGASDYGWNQSNGALVDAADNEIELSNDLIGEVDNVEGSWWVITILNPQGTGHPTRVTWIGGYWDDDAPTQPNQITGAGAALVAGATTDLRFLFSAGNIEECVYTLHGVRQ